MIKKLDITSERAINEVLICIEDKINEVVNEINKISNKINYSDSVTTRVEKTDDLIIKGIK